jgi:hypothetical protein
MRMGTEDFNLKHCMDKVYTGLRTTGRSQRGATTGKWDRMKIAGPELLEKSANCRRAAKVYEWFTIPFTEQGIYDCAELVIFVRADSAFGSQKAISMQRYSSIATKSSGRASSLSPVLT